MPATVLMMKFAIESGTSADIDLLRKLYDDPNYYLAATTISCIDIGSAAFR